MLMLLGATHRDNNSADVSKKYYYTVYEEKIRVNFITISY